jgi:hypothetical protein
MLGAPGTIRARPEGAPVTYPEPHRASPVRPVGDRERRVTLIVIVGSALAAGATATAGLLTVLGLL